MRKVQKCFYIEREMELLLKEVAQNSKISEAEVIRQAIQQFLHIEVETEKFTKGFGYVPKDIK